MDANANPTIALVLAVPVVSALLLSCTAVAAAQPARPAVFYILSRQALPPLDPAELPPAAREPYARVGELTARIRTAHEARPRNRAAIEGLDDELRRVEDELREALSSDPASLTAQGWLLRGELVAIARSDAWAEAMDRAAERGGPEPALDLGDAVDAWRRAAASAGDPSTAAWARYLEAWALGEMHDDGEARRALSIVAASDQAELAAEARLRLGEMAFDEGRWSLAAGWYARALPSLAAELRPIAIYKRAWALVLSGRVREAREAAADLRADAPEEIRAELGALL